MNVAIYVLLTCQPMTFAQRPKRTIGKMFESFMDTMRHTFGSDPPPPLPPDVIARITNLPHGMHYTIYPKMHMHVRPVDDVEKHIIYVKTAPPTMVRHSMPSDVDIIRFMPPLVQIPKPKTTTTIHYEIIPVPVPIHSSALEPALSVTNNHGSGTDDNEELNEIPQIPWSMEVLPPPVPTSKPSELADEGPSIPWNLHALPPPVATKGPQWQSNVEWTQSNPLTHINKHSFMVPLIQKKLVIPASFKNANSAINYGQLQQNTFVENHAKTFVPSSLQSEISIQPSLEIAAFSETHPVAHQLQTRSKFTQTPSEVSRSQPLH